jgi:TRAP-type mannitol/chloroaromatic compound transport system permease large subunit
MWLPAAVLFGGLIFGLALGLPIAFTLGSSAVIAAWIFQGTQSLSFVATNTFGMMRNLVLSGMPLFIFMAAMLERSGVAPLEVSLLDIYRSVIPFVGIQWIGVFLVMFFPQLALWLPTVAFGLK